ncbi:uncharacterized protein TNCV_1207781 [Trichonephila clavipes]|nr:uncharacterized protein TNCV_1207781 [Trichonephila clavipes]
MAGKDILEFVESQKNIIDADSEDENEMNNAAPVPMSSENKKHHENYALLLKRIFQCCVIWNKPWPDLEGESDFNDDHREEITDFVQSIQGFQEGDEEDVETWMAYNAEDCGFQMLNDDEIMVSVQEESDPVDDETNEDESNNNNCDGLTRFFINISLWVLWAQNEWQLFSNQPKKKLTVWCALWAGGIIGPYFFKNDEGHNATVNGDRYRAMITNFFITELNNHDVQELWFQQDGATCHTARATIDLLKDTFGDRLISRFGPVNWPPRSCDLTPLDYFLWGYVKSLVYADKP